MIMKNLGNKSSLDFYFVSYLKHNLQSVGNLTQKGYKVIFENNVYTVFDISSSHVMVIKVEMINNRIFPLHMKSGVMKEIGESFKEAS